ncbi:hypothetical protein CHIBA101_1636 [Actinomyces sp. Chiba101]|uniref:MAPEG family protein n=1 Tax=Actinomyces denticolens TaxID=52767 RepID=A0ABY1I816_9ACTO|nr:MULTISPECIES: hypothetical protein [Actinomyces]BAW93480.1 hypothetical protein CHIBA101_1636 [Actinomyces sp. Chiba101]GAV93676.1 hypothetical protein ADENT20671_0431 [Actinomyces denticolens]SHI73755.1 hypothetical protein SAMN05216246_104155 [Actinomyces denticolens]SUU02913.1 Uncharacterised protein [Actinomyces denticolens]
MSIEAVLSGFAAFIASAAGGWLFVRLLLAFARVPERSGGRASSPDGRRVPLLKPRAGQGGQRRSSLGDGPVGESGDRANEELLRGGAMIGVLERIAITGAVLAGQGTWIAGVIAVKGLGRWADLKDKPGSTERFIIGTLASMIWAVFCGSCGRMAIGSFAC